MFCGNIINFLEEWNERNLRRVGREDSGVQPFGLGRFGTNLDRRPVTHNTWTHPFRAGYVLLVSVSRCDFCYQDLSDRLGWLRICSEYTPRVFNRCAHGCAQWIYAPLIHVQWIYE